MYWQNDSTKTLEEPTMPEHSYEESYLNEAFEKGWNDGVSGSEYTNPYDETVDPEGYGAYNSGYNQGKDDLKNYEDKKHQFVTNQYN
jgi:hypothetical protein